MATIITSVQRPTTYKANHKTPETKEYNPISFKFVPIPNSQATNEDLVHDLSDECTKYYSIDRKSFYITIAPSGAEGTVLNETFPSSNQEHVLYGVPNTNGNVIYKLKSNNTEAYKCSGNNVKTLSLGNAELSSKSINTISMSDVKVQTRTDGELLIIDSDYTDEKNTVNSINSDGLIYVEVPSDLDIDYIEVKSNVLYLKGNFSSSYGNSALSNLYVCKYPYNDNNNDIRCVYSQGIYPSSVVSLIGNTFQIKLGSSTVQFTNELYTTRYFLEVNGEIKTGDSSLNLGEWEVSGEKEDSEYLFYTEQSNGNTYYYVKIGKNWYSLNDIDYSIDESRSTRLYQKSGSIPEDGFDTEWESNHQYIKKIRYMKTIKVSDTNDGTKIGIFSRVQNQFLPSPNIPHSSEVQKIIQISNTNPSSALTRFSSLDVDDKLVIDINDNNKVIFSDSGSNVSSLNYRLEDTTQ